LTFNIYCISSYYHTQKTDNFNASNHLIKRYADILQR
jgi:hypothetical protein